MSKNRKNDKTAFDYLHYLRYNISAVLSISEINDKTAVTLIIAEVVSPMGNAGKITSFLVNNPVFSTKIFVDMMKEQETDSDRKAYRLLQDLQSDGKIMKIGRGRYSTLSIKKQYRYAASPQLLEITEQIKTQYPFVSFQTWELFQWNEFVNHQLAHNAYFIEVENPLETTVFEHLTERYPKVLLNPDIETYYRYRTDDMIVVQRLLTGTPGPLPETRQASMEKLLVDLFSKKLTGQLIERAEYPRIYEDAFSKYAINESALFRYAGRRNLDKEIHAFIVQETNIRLRVEERT